MQDTEVPQPASRTTFYVAVGLITGSLVALYSLPRMATSPDRAFEALPASPAMVALVSPSTAVSPTTTAPISTTPSTTTPSTTTPPTTNPPTTNPPAAIPATTAQPAGTTGPVPNGAPTSPRPPLPANAPAWVAEHVEPGDSILAYAPIDDSRGILTLVAMSAQVRCRNPQSFAVAASSDRLALGGWAIAHPAGRWYVAPVFEECALSAYSIYDTATQKTTSVPAYGGFTGYVTSKARFTTRDDDGFWIYDLPSATYQRIWVPERMRAVLNGFEPDREGPAWSNGRIVEVTEGLVAHVQCLAASCANDTSVIGWFFVGDDNVIDPDRPLPKTKWPPPEFFCAA